jgi:hypothetical protein
MKTFVQIASYRDPQLPFTLRDCLANARYPNRLHFCVAHQYDGAEDIFEFTKNHPSGARFTFLHIPYKASRGACWARHQIQQQYCGEEFTLQLDSHHRFVKDWDIICIDMLKGLQARGFPKPLLTAYLPSFDPNADPHRRVQQPWRMNFDRFTPEGVIFFMPSTIPDWESLSQPVPARFFSAHFTFTLGRHCLEVPHDPNYYFHGEEISLAVRSYTYGYDLFHPHRLVAWHEYTRKGRSKHWDDDRKWHVRNNVSLKRNRGLLGIDDEGPEIDFADFGFGSLRTVAQYEQYAGIRFRDRAVQQYTLANSPPPNPPALKGHALWKYPFRRPLIVPRTQIPESDYDLWCVAFHDGTGREVYRNDVLAPEIRSLQSSKDRFYKILRPFDADQRPVRCVIWPRSKRKGWGAKITMSV